MLSLPLAIRVGKENKHKQRKRSLNTRWKICVT
jgi:hypothetical protein